MTLQKLIEILKPLAESAPEAEVFIWTWDEETQAVRQEPLMGVAIDIARNAMASVTVRPGESQR